MSHQEISSDDILYGRLPTADHQLLYKRLAEKLHPEAVEILCEFASAEDQTLNFHQISGCADDKIQVHRQLLVSAHLDDLEERDLIQRTGPLPDRNAPRSWYLTSLGAAVAAAVNA